MKTPLFRMALAAFAASAPLSALSETADEAAAREAAGAYASAVSAGDLAALWGALPESWRGATVDAAKALGAKAKDNPAVWTAARDCLSEVAATLAKKSGFAADLIARNGVPAAKSAIAADGSAPALVRTAAKLGAALKAATPETLSGGDLASVFSAPALALPGVTDAIPAAAAAVKAENLAARTNDDGSITVGVPGGSGAKAVKMVKKDGKWVPAPLAGVFSDSAGWKDAVSSLSLDGNAGTAVVSALAMLRKSAAGAAQTSSQEQFDKAATAASFPLLMLGSAASGQASAASGADAAADLLRSFLR